MTKFSSVRLTLLLFLLAIPGTYTCLAQQNRLPEKGEHVAYDHLKAYEGKWVFKAGKETFTLSLVLQKNRQGNDAFFFYMDQLEGGIERGNKNRKATDDDQTGYVLRSKAQTEKDTVELVFWDPVKQKSGEVTLRFAGADQTRLHWELTEHAELLVRSINKMHAPGFSVPAKMLFRRVE